MDKKEKFINVVEDLFRKTDMEIFCGEDYNDVMSYFSALKMAEDKEVKKFTELGSKIMLFMQENNEMYNNLFSSKIIADGIEITSRQAGTATRKLVSDGYVEKLGQNPTIYSLTDKGIKENLTK